MENLFQRANRQGAFIKIGISAPSGAGKTYSSLLIAKYLATRNTEEEPTIAVIDSEAGRASKHAKSPGVPPFDVLQIGPSSLHADYRTYHPLKFVELIKMAVANRYEVLIIDSASLEWAGSPEGCLSLVDSHKRGDQRNTQKAWGIVTPLHNAFVEAIIGEPIHIFVTFRAKQDRVIQGEDKSASVTRLGLNPTTRKDIEYEFDFFAEMDLGHTLYVLKGYELTDRVYHNPGKNFADDLHEWLSTADILKYGDGTPIPDSPVTMRIYKAYQADHDGEVPESREVLGEWHKSRDEVAENVSASKGQDTINETE